jgi:outer membrane protein
MTRWSAVLAAALTTAAIMAPALMAPLNASAQEPLRLDDVVTGALATHPALSASSSQASAAAATAAGARASWWPAVGATTHVTRYQEPMVVAPLHGFDPSRPPAFERTLVQGHLTVEWTLFDGGLRRARIGAADRATELADAAAELAADAVVAEAVSSYLAVLSARALLSAHDRQVEALKSERGRATRLFDEGRAPRVQVLRTDAALSRATAEQSGAAERAALAERRLARVAGLTLERVASAPLMDLAPSPAPVPGREVLLERARSASPAVARAQARAAGVSHMLESARSALLPRFSVGGRYSAFGSTATSFEPEWSASAQVSYPVFTGGARQRAVDRASSEAQAARAELRSVLREVEDGVDAALAWYRTAVARVAALEAAEAQSAEIARIEALALEAGAGVQTDYLRAEADLLTTRASLAEARHGAMEARVRLARVTGGLDLARVLDLLVEVSP